MNNIWSTLINIGLPSGIMGFGFWAIKRTIEKHESERRKHEEVWEKHNLILIRCQTATFALSEAVAKALKNGHTNGEVDKALQYAEKIKHEQKEFLEEQGMKSIL